MNLGEIVEKWSVLHTEDLLRDIFQQFGTKAAIGTSFQNDRIIDKRKFEDTLLSEGDKVEFVYYMGGGTAWLSW